MSWGLPVVESDGVDMDPGAGIAGGQGEPVPVNMYNHNTITRQRFGYRFVSCGSGYSFTF